MKEPEIKILSSLWISCMKGVKNKQINLQNHGGGLG